MSTCLQSLKKISWVEILISPFYVDPRKKNENGDPPSSKSVTPTTPTPADVLELGLRAFQRAIGEVRATSGYREKRVVPKNLLPLLSPRPEVVKNSIKSPKILDLGLPMLPKYELDAVDGSEVIEV